VERVSRSGKPRKAHWKDGTLSGLRALSIVAALVVAAATLLPARTGHRLSVLVDRPQIGDELNDVLTFILLGLAGLTVVGVLWKSRLARRLNMSWSLLVVGILYLFGLVVLASSTIRAAMLGLVSTGMGVWVRRLTAALDAEHIVAHAALTMVVVLAWRQKFALHWLALTLFAYGFALELMQQLVPGRAYGFDDLAANALGIALGVIGIALFDLLADVRRGPALDTYGEPHRRHSGRSSRSASGSSRRTRRAGLITALAGLSIALASVLAGSMAEFGLAEVGRQIFTQLAAAYAFTFWLGVAVMVIGGLMLRGTIGRRRRQYRPHRPHGVRQRQ
jgi:VanZ like family